MHGLGGGPRRPFSWKSRRSRLAAAGATAGALAVSAGVYKSKAASNPQQAHTNNTHALALPTPSIRLPASLVEAIAGAIGEVVQVGILYPLDTIKVRCQANGMMSTEVVKDLVIRSASRPASLVSSLYAGVGGATLCSIIIGAVHFSSYETSKRCMFERLPELLTPLQQALPAVSAPLNSARGQSSSSSRSSEQGAASGSGRSSQQQQQQQQQQDRQRSHAGASSSSSSSSSSVSSSESHTAQGQAGSGADSLENSSGSNNRRGRRSRRGHSRAESDGSQGGNPDNTQQQQQQQQQQDQSAERASAASSVSNTNQQPPPSQHSQQQSSHSSQKTHSQGQASQNEHQGGSTAEHKPPEQIDGSDHHLPVNLHLMDEYTSFKAADKLGVNMVASVITAIATALVESPVELFRHNQQAGTVEGNFMKEMLSTVRKKGPMGLYWGFLPHCFEALPHDISEMLVMGCMKDMHIDAMTLNSKPQHRFIRSIPVEAWDLTAGAASGVAAVLVSMPFDCIKTYMQTRGTDLSGQGVLGTANIFLRTGKDMVARKGPGCLYYGVVPRLLQQVPSSMMCWWAVHAVMRALQPWTIKDEKADEVTDVTKR